MLRFRNPASHWTGCCSPAGRETYDPVVRMSMPKCGKQSMLEHDVCKVVTDAWKNAREGFAGDENRNRYRDRLEATIRPEAYAYKAGSRAILQYCKSAVIHEYRHSGESNRHLMPFTEPGKNNGYKSATGLFIYDGQSPQDRLRCQQIRKARPGMAVTGCIPDLKGLLLITVNAWSPAGRYRYYVLTY